MPPPPRQQLSQAPGPHRAGQAEPPEPAGRTDRLCLGRAGLSRGHACRRRAAAPRRRVSGVGCAPYIISAAAFGELTISNLIALEHTTQPRLPADSEITENGLSGGIRHRSFQEETTDGGAAGGSFGRGGTLLSALFPGPVRAWALGGRCYCVGCGQTGPPGSVIQGADLLSEQGRRICEIHM